MPVIPHKSKNNHRPFSVNQESSKLEQKRNKQSRYAHIYNSRHWKFARKKALELAPCCHICEDKGNTVAATTVNHMQPLRTFLDPTKKVSEMNASDRRLAFGQDNLETLCLKCHGEEEAELIQIEKSELKQRIIAEEEVKRQAKRKEIKHNREASNRRDNFQHCIAVDEFGNEIWIDVL
jgi:5-methylcytosine-specific restriction endonuclease McrA